MTVKQKQLILCFFDCLPVSGVDGIWGPQSKAATVRLQDKLGIEADGDFGLETEGAALEAMAKGEIPTVDENEVVASKNETTTGTFWDEIEFFVREEFRCQCGGKYCNGFPVEPQENLVRIVDEIRRRLGIPVSIVDAGGSGVRCPVHNANVGGVVNSWHLYGRAADLHAATTPERMKAVAEEVMGKTGGIGIYDWGIHVDDGAYSRWDSRT